MALKGFTFDQMEVTAANDAGFYQWILPTDGVLWGCGLSNTVNSITFQAGMLVCGGRFVGFDGATTYTLSSEYATSTGYMRLVLTLDLSKQNTSGFAQGDVSWEYSATTEFSPLQQDSDFNNPYATNKKYQMQLCIYPITSGNLGNLNTGTAMAATPDLPLSGGTMTGTLTTTTPNINKSLLLLGDGTRKLSLRWSSSGSGDSVFVYVTPDGGTEQQIVNITAEGDKKYIDGLRMAGATAFTFADGLPVKNATVAGDLTIQFQNIFRIPGAIVIQMSIYHPSSDGIPDGGSICTVPSGYRPSKTYTAPARLQKSAGGIVPNGYVQIKSNGQVTVSKSCRYVEFTAIIPSTF